MALLVAAMLLQGSPASAIRGGQPAEAGRWNYHVALFRGGAQHCGGVLVAPRFVLTAAHCATGVMVYVGTQELSRAPSGGRLHASGGQFINVASSHIHPRYDGSRTHDIALLELTDAAPAGLGVATLAGPAIHDAIASDTTNAVAIGWGSPTRYSSADSSTWPPTRLQQATLTLQSPTRCDQLMVPRFGAYGSFNPSAHLCTEDVAADRGICQGDSGSPLFVRSGGIDYQVGISSFAEDFYGGTLACTTVGFTKVASYIDWINGFIGNQVRPTNGPPEAVGSVDELDLELGESARVSISGLFTDEEPERLTYAVSSSSPTAVSAEIAWPAVELEGLAHGAATVTLTATDVEGLSATLDFVARSGTTIAFADGAAPEGGTIRLRLVANRPVPRDLAVPYVLAAGDDPTNAADASDHHGDPSGTATLPAGATEAEVAVPILDDDLVEPVREHFVAMLAEPTANAGYGLDLKARATATIEEGVCDRSPAVRDELRRGRSCAAVADLSRHTALRLRQTGLTQLPVEDLLQLDQLRLLDLSDNRLSEWPTGVLEALLLLTSLHVDGNQISSLPQALGTHGALRELNLSRNLLTTLPAGAFHGLAGLERLHLSDNRLAALPNNTLGGLAWLRELSLDGNALRELPAGLFLGIGRLRSLQLQRNPGAPFMLTLEPTRADAEPWAPGPASVTMRVPSGAPFAFRSILTAPGASLSDGDAVSVPAGQALGELVTVAAEAPVIVRLTGPAVPNHECEFGEARHRPCFQGITTAASTPLVLFKQPPTVRSAIPPPQDLDIDNTIRFDLESIFESSDGEALTFAAESSNPNIARVRVTDRVLVVEALDEGMATVTLTATDAYGQTSALTFAVQATAQPRSRWRGWRLTLLPPPTNHIPAIIGT